jgi:hypothetical protein
MCSLFVSEGAPGLIIMNHEGPLFLACSLFVCFRRCDSTSGGGNWLAANASKVGPHPSAYSAIAALQGVPCCGADVLGCHGSAQRERSQREVDEGAQSDRHQPDAATPTNDLI